MVEEINYNEQLSGDINTKIRDIEEKQRVLKDRLLLIGQNLIEIKEKSNSKMLDIKKDIEVLKQNVERMSSFMDSISGEFSKFAKKDDLEILMKQAKMFQPLELATKEDLEKLKKN